MTSTTCWACRRPRCWRWPTASRNPAAGSGNAMGSLIAAYKSNTPLIVTAGQQTREMVLCEPYLTNTHETQLPLPWAKWVYQPARAEDVPAAFMRAYTIAIQPPARSEEH